MEMDVTEQDNPQLPGAPLAVSEFQNPHSNYTSADKSSHLAESKPHPYEARRTPLTGGERAKRTRDKKKETEKEKDE